jgi:SAM-dependent methyltransferase
MIRQEDRHLNYGREILADWTKGLELTSVLDVGVGHGADIAVLRESHPDILCHGIESNTHYANHALAQEKIDVVRINVERAEFPYSPNSFDLVIANQIFEHLKEIFWVFDQISRVLKISGYFYFGVPNLASLHNRILLALGRQPTCINNASAHLRGYTKPDVLNLLDACWPGGYRLLGFRGSNFYPFPPCIAKSLAKLLPNCAVTIFFFLQKTRDYGGEFIKYPEDLETNFFLGKEIHHKL